MTAAVLPQFFLLPSEMLRCVFLLIADLGKYQVNRPNRIHTGKAGVESNTHALVDRKRRQLISHLLAFLGTHSRKPHHVLTFPSLLYPPVVIFLLSE